MLGKVYSLIPDPKGYSKLVIQCKVPYSIIWKKYNIWKLSRLEKIINTPLVKETMLKFSEDSESQYPTLTSIELACLDICHQCQGFYESADAQQIECGYCSNIEPKERLDQELKLIHVKEKQYTFSVGVTLTFTNDEETHTFSTCVFGSSPLYNDIKGLIKDQLYHVRGWITSENNKGLDGVKALIELEEAPAE